MPEPRETLPAEKKVSVQLSVMDWQIVVACLNWHTAERRDPSNPLWIAGRNRAHYISEQIAARLPKKDQSNG